MKNLRIVLRVIIVVFSLHSCTKKVPVPPSNINTPNTQTNNTNPLYCDAVYQGITYSFPNQAYTWTENEQGDTIIEINNNAQYLKIQSLKYTDVRPWVANFDTDQYSPGNMKNKTANMNYVMIGDTMQGTCSFNGVDVSFRLMHIN
jgi:predicted small lipoprotein YifL